MQYVYILQCSDGHLYTGCTENLQECLNRHKIGNVPATKSSVPVTLVYYCAFPDKAKAFEFEKYLKSGSGRAFRQKRFI